MVTSTTVTPPAIMASTTACAWAMDFARKTGTRPTRSRISAVVSNISGFLHQLRFLLAGYARRPAFHGPFDFSQCGHAGVAGCGHGQCAVGDAALDSPIDGLSGEKAVNQAGGEAVAAADAIENVDVALRHVHNLVLVKRDGAPRIAACGLRGAQCAGDEFQVRIGCGYFAQHVFV